MKSFLLSIILLLITSQTWAFDPMFSEQWGLLNQGQKVFRTENDIRREEIIGVKGMDIDWPGMDALSGLGQEREVIVAVIDSGIDMHHPEFKDRLYQGVDFLDNEPMIDDIGHGTHVAGIIAANADGMGVQGVTPGSVKILPLKVLNKNTTSFVYKKRVMTDIIANAITYAILANVSVINMSLGWPQLINTPKIIKALDAASDKGIVLVAASGNNNKDVPTWPCAHPAVICVGAINNQGQLTDFSNHGGKVDLVAPGEWIVSTFPRNLESRTLRKQGFEAKNGSSQAAPFVSAAVALIKLQNPEITAQEIKARLFASAKKLVQDQDNRFVRFGALSITGALAQENSTLASIVVKNLITVAVQEDGRFQFSLPLEILGKTHAKPEVELLGLNASILVNDMQVHFNGRLTDLNIDSEIPVTFKVSLDGIKTETSMTLSFARSLAQDELSRVPISDIPAASLMVQQGATKVSRLNIVSVEDAPLSDFHGYIQQKEGDQINVTTIRANLNGKDVFKTKVTLKDHHQILSVFEKDINFDGMSDLIFYGMNAKRDHLILTFTNLDGENLLGIYSRWELPITPFEGLPLKDGEKGDFSWLKITTFMGELLVPYYQKSGLLPDLDNSKRLLENEPKSMIERLFYWEPFLDNNRVVVRPRVVDSVATKIGLRKTLNAAGKETLKIEKIIPQTYSEKLTGTTRHLLSVGDGFSRRFNHMTVFSPSKYVVSLPNGQYPFLAGANVLVTRELDDNSISTNPTFMSLLNRSSAHVIPLGDSEILDTWSIQTSGWNNPFFEVVAAFKGYDRRALIFESRYHVYLYGQFGKGRPQTHRLPINRDSSFPGVNFSETLQSALIRIDGENHPGVAVNSTLIYGDRLYTMVFDGQKFYRPIEVSISIPANCVPVRTQVQTKSLGHSAYVMLCKNTSNEMELSFYPLKIN